MPGRYQQGSERRPAPPSDAWWPPPAPPRGYPRPRAAPRPPLRWWHHLLIVCGGLVVAVVSVAAVPVLFVLAMTGNHTDLADRSGAAWRFDDRVVSEAATDACARLETTLRAIPRADRDASARPARLRAENDAIHAFVATVRAAGAERLAGDRPAADWVADWTALAAARESYARALEAGRSASFELPLDPAGYPIVERMDGVTSGCDVPPRLYVLD